MAAQTSNMHQDVVQETSKPGLKLVIGHDTPSDAPAEAVVALYDFTPASASSATSCLYFQKHQTIQVFSKDSSGWWWGRLEDSDETGWFPSNYTRPCTPQQLQPEPDLSPLTVAPPMSRSNSESEPLEQEDETPASVLQAIHFLQEAAQARRTAHYQPSVAVVISGVRSILASNDCLAKESSTLRRHPTLVKTRRDILANLANLVQQARKCNSAAATDSSSSSSDTEVTKLLRLSDTLLQNANFFVAYVRQHQIPNTSSSSASTSPVASTTTKENPPRRLKQRTKSMGDLKSRRKLAEHAEQLHQAQKASQSMRRLGSIASANSDSSAWPPSLSSAGSSCDSIDGPKTPQDLRAQANALDTQHDQLLSVVAAFIGHVHAHTRDSHPSSYAHLIDMTCEAVLLVKDIINFVEDFEKTASDHSNIEAGELAVVRRSLYDAINDLVAAVDIATNVPDPDLDETEEDEKERLLKSATKLLRCASDNVELVKKSLRSDAASRVFDMVAAPQTQRQPAPQAKKQAFETFMDQHEPSSFLRERHTLSMLGRTADSLDQLKHRHQRRDSFSSSVGSSRSPHSSRNSTGSNHSASMPALLDLPSAAPASLRPTNNNTLSGRRGHAPPTPLNLNRPASTGEQFEDALSDSLASATVRDRSPEVPAVKSLKQAAAKPLPDSPLSNSQSSTRQSSPEKQHPKHHPEEPLHRGYEPREVVFSSDGQVTGGTLRCLVERMSLHDVPIDSCFSQTFFLTFRLFTSPSELVNALVARFDLAPPADLPQDSSEFQAWHKTVAIPVRLRVVNMLKTWLEGHWQPDTDMSVLVPLLSFAQNKVTPAMGQAGSRLTELVQKRTIKPEAYQKLQTLQRDALADRMRQGKPAMDGVPLHFDSPTTGTFPQNVFQTPPPPSLVSRNFLNTVRTVPFARLSVTDFDPTEVARQFTIMESRLFCLIQPQDLFMQSQGKSPRKTQTSVIKQMSALSTKITGWIAEVILNEQDAKRRTSVLKWFLKLADRCHGLQNYNTLMAILAALNSSTISRLTRTWDGLSVKYKVLLEGLRKATEHTRNYAEYRGALRRAMPPALPFLGLYLTDLTFCYEGNPSTRASKLDPELKLINFDRYRKMSRIVGDLQRFQVPYNLSEVSEIQMYLKQSLQSMEALGGNDVDRLYRRSLILEPRETTSASASSGASRSIMSSTPLSPVMEKRFDAGAAFFGKSRMR